MPLHPPFGARWRVPLSACLVSLCGALALTPAPAHADLRGEYFATADLSGAASERTDPTVDFDWGRGAPAGLSADRFSARWTGFVTAPKTEAYTFMTTADDGVRLWVDGKLVVDNWSEQPATTRTASVNLVAGRSYAIKLEYYENQYDATVRLRWSSSTTPSQVIPADRLSTNGQGLLADYYATPDLSGERSERVDTTVNFDWGRGAPAGLGADRFSARWTGYVRAPKTERYAFSTTADDGVRLWVDGKLVVDNWVVQPATTRTASVDLVAGRSYTIRAEYYEDLYDATMRLRWSSPTTPSQIIPGDVLSFVPGMARGPVAGGSTPAPAPAPSPTPSPTPAPPPNPTPVPSPSPTPSPEEDLSVPAKEARSAASFVDSIGVNVHMFYNGSHYYEDTPRVANVLQDIGIEHVRDGHQGNRQDQFDRLNYLADRGIGSTLIQDPRADPHFPGDKPVTRHEGSEDPSRYGKLSLEHRMNELRLGKIRGVQALEGANEYNSERDWDDFQWVPTIVNAQRRLKELNDQFLRLPLLGPSFTNWQSYEEARKGGLGAFTPIGNIHPYPGGKAPASDGDNGTLKWHLVEEVDRLAGRANAPWQATETGYHTATNQWHGHPPASERAAGIYAPKLFLEYFRQGGQRTFWYEMIDGWDNPERNEQEANFGLIRQDWSYKPAGRNLKTLIGALNREGTATTGSLRYQVDNAPADLQQVLLRRGDGSYALALWQDDSVWNQETHQDITPGAATVQLKLGAASDVEVYKVGQGATPTRSRAQTLSVEVPADDTVIVGIK